MSKKDLRLSLLVLSISLVGVMAFAHPQESATVDHAQVAKADSGCEHLQKYNDISVISVPEGRDFYEDFSATDQSNLWKVHLALYLVKRPELNGEQKQIILDAVSLASPDLFATTDSGPLRKTKVDESLQSLTQRALRAFPMKEVGEVFADVGGGQAQDDLFQKYKDISALPMRKRKAAFRKASPKDRSDLWRTHLALYLVNHAELNQGQKQITLEGMSLATPQGFDVRADNPAWAARVEELRSLENRILAGFSKEEGARIFATLGDPELPNSLSSSGPVVSPKSPNLVESRSSIKYNVRTLNRFVGQGVGELMDMENACGCSHASDWCWNRCGGSSTCSNTTSGCGTLWQYACDGMCT